MRVLIADDDPIIRLDLKQMLENLDHMVVAEVEDGQAAVDMAIELKPDVCVLDVKMPVLDGIDAAQQIVGAVIAPVILLTAYSDQELINRASEAGVFGYLVKPFKPSDLSPAMEIARSRFEQSAYLTQQITNLEERIEVRKLIERAKGVLVEHEGLSECDAYRKIQQTSMNERRSMKEVAEEILDLYSTSS